MQALCIGLVVLTAAAGAASAAEFRAFWIDAWGAGILNQSQVDTLLGVPGTTSGGQIRAANCNAVVVQVRRNCDAAYPSSMGEPYMSGLTPADFNALQAVINAAHDTTGGKKRIEVHAWIVSFRTSGGTVYSQHSSTPTGSLTSLDNYWITRTDGGAEPDTYALDPGHPLAEEYTVNVAMDLVNNFDIDGIHYDYIRFNANNEGYNPTSVARYNQRYGLSGSPTSSTEQWKQWRRDQVSSVVRKVYAKVQSVKPWVKQTAAGVTWNPSPTSSTRTAFQSTRPYYDVYSDWDSWLQEGILDAAIPMTYYDYGGSYRADWTRWINFLKDRHGNRHMYIGPGIYLNSLSNAITELQQTRTASPAGNYAQGFCGYSYRVPYVSGTWSGFSPSLLSQVTPTWDDVPAMSWKTSPTKGHISGTVTIASTGKWSDGAYGTTVAITGPESRSMLCDGTGFYAFIDLTPGTYTVTASRSGYPNATSTVVVQVGSVTGNMYVRDFALGATNPPVISNVQSSSVTGSSATITWTTDVPSDSQVQYGLTTSYGQSSTLNTSAVTLHSVTLTGLQQSTTYHFRVRSANAYGTTYSSDYTFTTTDGTSVDDIIIESRSGGQNYAWYSESGSLGDSTSKSAAAGVTAGIGSRYGSTYISVANEKHAYFTADIAQAGTYEVFATWGAGANRRNPIRHAVTHLNGTTNVDVDQSASSDTWVSLGTYQFAAGSGTGRVDVNNTAIDVSGSFYADAVKWVYKFANPSTIVITNVQAGSITANSAAISWTTNEAATSQVQYGTSTSYGSTTTLDSNLVTSHAQTLSGLTAGTLYHYRVVSTNANGTTYSPDYTFTTLAPPAISAVAASGITSSGATITWTTNQASTSQVQYGTTTSYGSSTTLDTSLVTSHSQTLGGLAAGTLYHYRVISTNANGTSTSSDYTFTTLGPPAISSVAASAITNSGATIGWTTDQASTSQVQYGTTTSYGSTTTLNSSLVTSHSQTLSGLAAKTLYHYRVISTNANGSTTSSDYTFTTSGPPAISNVQATGVTATSATITWTTDTASDSKVDYGLTTSYGSQATSASQVTSHSVTLTGLTAGTTYHFKCTSANAYGTGASTDYTFVTGSGPSISNVSSSGVTSSSATITWTTDQAASSTVNYGTTTSYGSQVTNSALVTSHSLTLTGLAPCTAYHFQCVSVNANGTATSSDYVFATGAAPSEIILDDGDTGTSTTGTWTTRTDGGYGGDYRRVLNRRTSANATYTWTPTVTTAGYYAVYCQYPVFSNNTTAATYTVTYNGGTTSATFNQTTGGGQWNLIATNLPFAAGTGGKIVLNNKTGESGSTTYVIADAVKLVYLGSTPAPSDVIVDDQDAGATFAGTWTEGSYAGGYDTYYHFADNVASGATHAATWTPTLAASGLYDVYCWYNSGSNRSTAAKYVINYSGGSTSQTVNQTAGGGAWVLIGSGLPFAAGTSGSVTLNNATGETSATTVVIADAIRWVYAGAGSGSCGDMTPPSVAISAPSGSLTRSGPISYTVSYSDDVAVSSVTLTSANVALNKTGTANGTVTVSGSGTATRTVTVSNITGDGTLGISIAAGTATDAGGNLAPGAGPSATFTVDNTAPTVAIGAPSAALTQGGPVTYTVTYAGASAVTLANANVTLNKTGTANGTVAVSGTGTSTRTVTVSGITGDGTLGISIAAGTAADAAGNTAPAVGPSAAFTVDNTGPAVSISAASASVTKSGPVTYTVTYTGADAVTLANANVTLNKTGTANGTVAVSGTGTSTRTVTISGITGDGTLGISIAAGTATDTAGNSAAAAGPSATFTVDNTAPAIAIGAPSATITKGGPVTYTITYTGASSVTLASGNVTLNKTGTASGTVAVSGTGASTRTVTISGITGDGTLAVTIGAGTATDEAGNSAAATGMSLAFTVDNTAPVSTATPAGGLFNANQSVTLSAPGSTAIYYTTDGSAPTSASTAYTAAIPITADTTLKFFAKDEAGNEEAVKTEVYTIDKTAPVTTASPAGGTYTSEQSVTLTADETAAIYYTTDGSTPTSASTAYSAAIPITADTTLKFFAKDEAGNEEAVKTEVYVIDTEGPGAVVVTDDGVWTPSVTTLRASWTEAIDAGGSGIASYEYAIGTAADTQDTKGWTSVGNVTAMADPLLTLSEGQTYFIQVRATDNVGNTGPAAASDGITVAPGVDPIGALWSEQDGSGLSVRGKVVTRVLPGMFWLEEADRSAGIKVLGDASVAPGDLVSVAGVLGLSGGQRVLHADVVEAMGTAVVPVALGMKMQSLGGASFNIATPGVTGATALYNAGLLVKAWGAVTGCDASNPADRFFYFDDGSNLSDGGAVRGVRVRCGAIDPPCSGFVQVTGVVGLELAGTRLVPVIVVTSASDIVDVLQ